MLGRMRQPRMEELTREAAKERITVHDDAALYQVYPDVHKSKAIQ
jgi:hypothetical protein